MLVGMGVCGLLALGIYLLACWQQAAIEPVRLGHGSTDPR